MPKRSWPSKESAEQERAKHKDARLVVYPCPVHHGYWHLGYIRRKRASAAQTPMTERKDDMHQDLAQALQRGWKIFPLIHQSRFAVSQPLIEHATDSAEQVELWQKEYPNCGWAVATGERSGIFALEISFDLGLKKIRSLCHEQSDLTNTLQIKTSSRVTLFYQWPRDGFPTCAQASIAPGIRLLQETHYAMLSATISGDCISHEAGPTEVTLCAAPAWLIAFLFERAQQTRLAEIVPFSSVFRIRHPVLLKFEKRESYWLCSFLAKSRGEVYRQLRYSTPDKIIAIAERGGASMDAQDRASLHTGIENGQGSILLNLTPSQYWKLRSA